MGASMLSCHVSTVAGNRQTVKLYYADYNRLYWTLRVFNSPNLTHWTFKYPYVRLWDD